MVCALLTDYTNELETCVAVLACHLTLPIIILPIPLLFASLNF